MLALHRLTSLDLSNNSLADVDRVLAKLPSLVSVNLSHNELREMPAALLIPTMRRINLSHNAIVELPRRIYKLTGLETLVLCHNKLETISPYISHLKALRELKVSNNRLQSLPAEIRKFRRVRLQNLDLSGNPFGVCSLPEYTALALRFTVPSLRELAARTVLNSRTVVDRAELPWMINRYADFNAPKRVGVMVASKLTPTLITPTFRFLKSAEKCTCCGGAFFHQSVAYVVYICTCLIS